MTDSEKTCLNSLNYEAEYERSMEMVAKLHTELCDARQKCECLETEVYKLRAQMDVVYLIFGGSK